MMNNRIYAQDMSVLFNKKTKKERFANYRPKVERITQKSAEVRKIEMRLRLY